MVREQLLDHEYCHNLCCLGVVADTVTQNVMVVPLGGHKWQWLIKNLVKFMSEGSVLVFVTKKQNCEELAHNLKVKAEIDCRYCA